MRDYGDEAAEKAIKELNKKIQEVYGEAERDLQEKMDDFVRKYKVKEKKYLEQLEAGSITQADFDAWKQGQIFQGRQWRTKQRSIADVLHRSNEVSTRMINDMALGVCAENVNYAAYTIEQGFGINFGFNIYDETTVANLIKKEPDVLPKWKIDQHKDYVWNKKKLNNAVTQGIIQGEKLDEIAKRVADGLCGSNKNLMKTFATTAMTGAQNAGRDISYKNAQKLGINLKKEWVATLDMRTRSSHRKLDGQKAEIDEPFKSEFGDIMFPGDPHADAADVYNCRCTMIADLVDYPAEEYERYDNIEGKPIKGMSYEEWERAKSGKGGTTTEEKVSGKNPGQKHLFKVFNTGEEATEYFGRKPDRRLRRTDKDEYKKQVEKYKTETTFGSWEDGLTYDEKDSIAQYSGDAYAGINGLLRHQMTEKMVSRWNDTIPIRIEDMITHIDSAIDKFELKDDITVFRTCKENVLQNLKLEKGSVFHDDGFGSSCVLPEKVARGNIVMEINVPAGKGRGAWINPMSGAKDEEWEFLIQRGSNYRVTEIETKGKDTVVHLDWIGTDKKEWSYASREDVIAHWKETGIYDEYNAKKI